MSRALVGHADLCIAPHVSDGCRRHMTTTADFPGTERNASHAFVPKPSLRVSNFSAALTLKVCTDVSKTLGLRGQEGWVCEQGEDLQFTEKGQVPVS